MNSAEDQLGLFAQLYSLPWLSFRGVLWERQQRGAKGYAVEDVMLAGGGDKHPNAYGHRFTTPPLLTSARAPRSQILSQYG